LRFELASAVSLATRLLMPIMALYSEIASSISAGPFGAGLQRLEPVDPLLLHPQIMQDRDANLPVLGRVRALAGFPGGDLLLNIGENPLFPFQHCFSLMS
jgi:hypothetical protein